ncbi:hypothetical protein BAZSYMA_ACONTIG41858_6 [Bathymodiolus azoricus thioautotrophic gill symbiont]|uniref:Uncharacterized protein n=1 Tax=Bathymodiolus azoricus thioautotrophic gill symbiont TaxID=235205 RepID=A0A1H6LY15_9GAMM|nr:hypothetical protein BAZSYMA_ACONTIG41858_6 [Bathymodiolus azoricus thioautotrophic gill symbiont]
MRFEQQNSVNSWFPVSLSRIHGYQILVPTVSNYIQKKKIKLYV